MWEAKKLQVPIGMLCTTWTAPWWIRRSTDTLLLPSCGAVTTRLFRSHLSFWNVSIRDTYFHGEVQLTPDLTQSSNCNGFTVKVDALMQQHPNRIYRFNSSPRKARLMCSGKFRRNVSEMIHTQTFTWCESNRRAQSQSTRSVKSLCHGCFSAPSQLVSCKSKSTLSRLSCPHLVYVRISSTPTVLTSLHQTLVSAHTNHWDKTQKRCCDNLRVLKATENRISNSPIKYSLTTQVARLKTKKRKKTPCSSRLL